MDTKYTPGPWNIQGGKGKHGDLFVWKAGEYFGGHAIATVHEEVEERAKANAHLISAAPELLEALQEIVTHATKYGAAPLSALLMFDRARSAIAKAKGKDN